MGCSSSCQTFEIFSSALEWVAYNHLNIPHLIHILVDFLLRAPTLVQCRINLEKFLHLCGNLGVLIAHEKTAGPQRLLTFAGIELDTVQIEALLPADKIAKCN